MGKKKSAQKCKKVKEIAKKHEKKIKN